MEKSHTATCPNDQRNKGKQKTDPRASFLLLCIFTDTHIFSQINNAIKIGHTTYQTSSGEDFFRNKTPKHPPPKKYIYIYIIKSLRILNGL